MTRGEGYTRKMIRESLRQTANSSPLRISIDSGSISGCAPVIVPKSHFSSFDGGAELGPLKKTKLRLARIEDRKVRKEKRRKHRIEAKRERLCTGSQS